MANDVIEVFAPQTSIEEAGSPKQVQHTVRLAVTDATSRDDAIAAARASAYAPATLTVDGRSLVRASIRAVELENGTDYRIDVEYDEPSRERAEKPPEEAGDEEWSFEIVRERTPIRWALKKAAGGFEQVLYKAAGKEFNRNGLVGVRNGEAEGVVYDGNGNGISIRRVMAGASITATYLNTLQGLIGSRNDASFKGFIQGLLLLDAVRGYRRNNQAGTWDVTFSFLLGTAINNQPLIDGVPNITALAHDYIEQIERRTIDGAGREKTEIIGAVVSTLFPYGDFSGLGIGT